MNSELGSFITGIAIGGLLVFILFNWLVSRILRSLTPDPVDSNKILTRLEEHNGVFLLYLKDTNEFLAQGISKNEIQQRVKEKFKNAEVYISGDPETLRKFNHENCHSQ